MTDIEIMTSGYALPGVQISLNVSIAAARGVTDALILQQIHYNTLLHAMYDKNGQHYHDGRYWMYMSYPAWHEQFPWLGESTIRHAISGLEKEGLIFSGTFNQKGYDKTKWYCVNYTKLAELVGWNDDIIKNARSAFQKKHPFDTGKIATAVNRCSAEIGHIDMSKSDTTPVQIKQMEVSDSSRPIPKTPTKIIKKTSTKKCVCRAY